MATRMSTEFAINALMHITRRQVIVIAWLLFALVHTALLSLTLLALWWYQATPADLTGAYGSLAARYPFLATGLGMLATLGLSLGEVAWAYAKAWKWLLDRWLARFVSDFEID